MLQLSKLGFLDQGDYCIFINGRLSAVLCPEFVREKFNVTSPEVMFEIHNEPVEDSVEIEYKKEPDAFQGEVLIDGKPTDQYIFSAATKFLLEHKHFYLRVISC